MQKIIKLNLNKAIVSEKEGDIKKAIEVYKETQALLNYPKWIDIKLCSLECKLLVVNQKSTSQPVSQNFVKPIDFIDNAIEEDDDFIKWRPEEIPPEFVYPTQVHRINDYSFIEKIISQKDTQLLPQISVVIPVYERREHLSRTLAALTLQTLDKGLFEVIVVDDGSACEYLDIILKYEHYLDIRFGCQKRCGYRPGAARNLGARMAKNPLLFFLDSDILLPPTFLEVLRTRHSTDKKVVTMGTRYFVDANNYSDDDFLSKRILIADLPQVIAENTQFKQYQKAGTTYDWRLDVYTASRNLKDHLFPFICLGAGHFSIDRTGFINIGGFDEDFCDWGGEDIELGYRLYNEGYYFIPILEPRDYHQEPKGYKNEINRDQGYEKTKPLLAEKCPAPFCRPLNNVAANVQYKIPKVSIYMPAYNAASTIIRAVESVLIQDYQDIEVCICDDGSTDHTVDLLQRTYANNSKVHWVTQKNDGISSASNTALSLCKGMYIGQLDADDELMPGVITKLVEVFDKTGVGLAYTDYEVIDTQHGKKRKHGWSSNVFNRYVQLIGNMFCHLRFFRRRSLAQIGYFDESLSCAVDFDFYTRMSEVVISKKVHFLGYRYYWHTDNISHRRFLEQQKNHVRVINKTLKRIGADSEWYTYLTNPIYPKNVHLRQISKVYSDDCIQWVPIANDFPFPPYIGVGNDYSFIEEKKNARLIVGQNNLPVSIVIPIYNRHERLAKTLAGLVHQSYPLNLIEVVIADDGSTDAVIQVIKKYDRFLNIKYVRQSDRGFRVGHARNLGVRAASNECIIGLDCDLIPSIDFVKEFMQYLNISDQVLCLGQYKFIDTNHLSDDDFLNNSRLLDSMPQIMTENTVVRPKDQDVGLTVDWRLQLYRETNQLKDSPYPYQACSGGQVAFHRVLYNRAGGYDEDFNAWGCEDNEFGFRMYEAGAYLIPVLNAIDYHQEPPDGKNETDRHESWNITRPLLQKKSPPFRGWFGYPWTLSADDVPKVSIYIPSLNNGHYLVEAVNSCLNQSYQDLEVCILDSGSTDNTLDLLNTHFSGNPRVRWKYRKCDTVTEARHYTLQMCRGMYVGQLDSDDVLYPHAVETLVKVLDEEPSVSLVYSRYEKIDEKGDTNEPGWCSGEYSRLKLMTSMCVHHFRMFRMRAWRLSGGFKEDELKKFTYAEDFLMALRLSLRGEVRSINEVLYRYRIHTNNITNKHDNENMALQTCEAARAIVKEMGLEYKIKVFTPYPDRPGIVGYVINNQYD
jgi:glycosyltransferase involved in cell wall biosynthesis